MKLTVTAIDGGISSIGSEKNIFWELGIDLLFWAI